MNILIMVGTAVSLLTSVVAIVVVIANLRSSVDALNKQEDRLTGKHDLMLKDQTELLVLVKSFISEQAVVNKQVAKTLEALLIKLERHERDVNENHSALSLLSEVLQNKRIIDISGE
jgi:hypothetical protein